MAKNTTSYLGKAAVEIIKAEEKKKEMMMKVEGNFMKALRPLIEKNADSVKWQYEMGWDPRVETNWGTVVFVIDKDDYTHLRKIVVIPKDEMACGLIFNGKSFTVKSAYELKKSFLKDVPYAEFIKGLSKIGCID